MREIQGELWDYYREGFVVCLTTNGMVKRNGECVMGRGCAFEATQRIPGIAKFLGDKIKAGGNVPHWLNSGLISFPVKHHWREEADLELIRKSANWLEGAANNLRQKVFVLPRPGCGNGRLRWESVQPVIQFLPGNVWVISR